MMKINTFIISIMLLLLGYSPCTHAKAGDASWVQCVWKNAPVSADNWLKMRVPDSRDYFDVREKALGHRLLAVCSGEPADELKPSKVYNWKSIAAALKVKRPKQFDLKDSETITVEICKNTTEDKKSLRVDVVRLEASIKMISYQQYYAEFPGFSGVMTPLPEGIRLKPDIKIQMACGVVDAMGIITAPNGK
jgi:hypothetical protein